MKLSRRSFMKANAVAAAAAAAGPVSYTHLRAHETGAISRMPSSA